MKILYAIAGRAGAGKDTTANMLAFLNNRYIVDGESYDHWFEFMDNDYMRIFHFAEPLKQVIHNMFNIPLFYLSSHKYKDELWFDLNTHEFKEGKQIGLKDNLISIEDLEKVGLRKIIESNNILKFNPLIKLRTLLQYIGTDLCRNLIDDHIWTSNVVSKVNDMFGNVDDCYIADMRFKEEFNYIEKYTKEKGIKLVTIFVTRPNNSNEIADNHISENIYLPCTKVLCNDGTLEDLFNKVKEIYHENC